MIEPTTVMIAQADVGSRNLTSRVLRRWGLYEVVEASDGEQALALLRPELEVAVLDWALPGADAVELCRLLRGGVGAGHRYVIAILGASAHDQVMRALEAGADDYALKPVDPDDLLERVVAGQTALKRARSGPDPNPPAETPPHRDPLTGLFTRDYFDGRLEEELERARNNRQPLALTLVDIDGIERLNEAHGPAVGQQILQDIGAMIREQTRSTTDVAARFGAARFGIIAPNTNIDGARGLGERMRRLALHVRVRAQQGLVAVTASVGFAIFGRRLWGERDPGPALIQAAQHRLYQAGLHGGNCVAG